MEKVVSACSLLFGTRFFVSQSILDWLQVQDVAVAFQRTIEKHIPAGVDIMRDGGRIHAPTLRKYIRAYYVLTRHLEQRDSSGRSAAVVFNHYTGRRRLTPARPKSGNEIGMSFGGGRVTFHGEIYYEGNMIPTKLRFGSYLYYRGLISYEMLLDSLDWQKRQRPLMGQIAMKAGFISPSDFAQVLFYLRVGESFGRVACEHGKLSATQVNRIADVQKKFNCKIGSYFVEKGILSQGLIETCHRQFCTHNCLYAS